MPESRIIDEAEDLAALEAQWWRLWRCASAVPFLSPAWLLPWWRVFEPGALRIVAVSEGDRLVALAPFYLDRGRLLPIGIALSDYLGLIVDPACSEALPALTECVAQMTDWEEWSLEELPPESAALRLPALPECRDEIRPQSACPVLPIAEAGLARVVPRAKLRKLRMARHRASRRGAFSVQAVSGPELEGFLGELIRLHRARWRERGGSEALGGEAVATFLGSAAPGLQASGLGRFFLLRLDGRCAGAFFGLSDGRRAYAWQGGFDPEFGYESPGTILIGHAIESAMAEGCREFHFLRGRERYKYDWGAVDRWSVRRVLSRESLHA